MVVGISLRDGISLHEGLDEITLSRPNGDQMRFLSCTQHIKTCLRLLRTRSLSAVEIINQISAESHLDVLGRFRLFSFLKRLEKKGWLSLSFVFNHHDLICLQPFIGEFNRSSFVDSDVVSCSPFASIKLVDVRFCISVPYSGSKIYLPSLALGELQVLTAEEHKISQLRSLHASNNCSTDFNDLIVLLLSANILEKWLPDGQKPASFEYSSNGWSSIDLDLHCRSRAGWHDQVNGKRIVRCAHLSKDYSDTKASLGSPCFEFFLPPPHLEKVQDAFFAVLERRKTVRSFSSAAIPLDKLSTLLWYVMGSSRNNEIDKVYASNCLDRVFKYIPSGGATYEIDFFVSVESCESLFSGIYFYDSRAHSLQNVNASSEALESLWSDACGCAGIDQRPQILIHMVSKFSSISHNYEGIAYSLCLKHVGVIFQQLYLVSTALGLAPCALGGGDSVAFSRATELHPASNALVGEFMVGLPAQGSC